jgi:hypothetical protein
MVIVGWMCKSDVLERISGQESSTLRVENLITGMQEVICTGDGSA